MLVADVTASAVLLGFGELSHVCGSTLTSGCVYFFLLPLGVATAIPSTQIHNFLAMNTPCRAVRPWYHFFVTMTDDSR